MTALKDEGDCIRTGDPDVDPFKSIVDLSTSIFIYQSRSVRYIETAQLDRETQISVQHLTYALGYKDRQSAVIGCIETIASLYKQAIDLGAVGIIWRRTPQVELYEHGYYFSFRVSFWNQNGQVFVE
jgi:hypothetical protein